MKCCCNDKDCTAEIGVDSVSGIIIAERVGKKPIGVYVDVATAVALSQQLRSYIVRQSRRSVESTLPEHIVSISHGPKDDR